MRRLFISLYVLILAVVFGIVFSVNPIIDRIFETTLASEAHRQFHIVVDLLDSRLQQSDDEKEALALIKKDFVYDVDLVEMDALDITRRQRRILDQRRAIIHEIEETEYLSLQSNLRPGKVWRLQFEGFKEVKEHDLVMGPMNLLRRELQPYPEEQWPQRLQASVEESGSQYPLQFIAPNHADILDLSERQQRLLKEHKIISLQVETAGERHYYAVPDSDWVLKIGPMGLPAIISYIEYLLLGFIALLFALSILFWLHPLWRNLQTLESASEAIGNGRFDARASIQRFSPIRKIQQGFNHMAMRIQSLITSHKDLTNAVSHELRTPLARMRFGLEMLENSETERDKARFIKELSTDIEEMDALVDELLTYARFERARPDMDFQDIVLVPWVHAQVARAQKLTDKVNISFHHEGLANDQHHFFESRLMARALSNLLSNAIRHASKEIHVTVKSHQLGFSLFVDDDGEGVPRDKRSKLFDLFARGDESRNRNEGGYGIGLSIVKQVAEWHEGKAMVDDSPLGGARFVMEVSTSATSE